MNNLPDSDNDDMWITEDEYEEVNASFSLFNEKEFLSYF